MRIPRRDHVARFVLYALAALCVVIVALGVVVAATKSSDIRATQEDRLGQIASNDRVLTRIQSCTTPGRRCYERGQKQTAEAVGDINRIIVYAAACASGPSAQTADQIQACVVKRLAEKPTR